MQVLSEEPPLLGFGDAALTDFDGAKFIPAFRNGQPVESNVKIPVYYKPSLSRGQMLDYRIAIVCESSQAYCALLPLEGEGEDEGR